MLYAMSWVTGARRDYPANLSIVDDAIAYVEFLSEPASQTFGKKKLKDGTEADDVRVRARVTYLGGSARSKKKGEDSLPAKMGEEYTLWIGTTLKGKILDCMAYEDGPPPTMVGTKFKVWRSQERHGGHRLYDAELLSSDFSFDPTEVKAMAEDGLMVTLKESIDKLESLELNAWHTYCEQKGAANGEAITKKMAEQGMLTLESTKVVKIE